MTSCQLFNDDCLKIMAALPEQSVDLIVCDPPYGTTLIAWDTVIPIDKMWEAYKRILKPKGAVVLFGSQPFTSALVMSNTKWFKHELIWDKNKCGSPGLAKFRPMKSHENILIFAPKTTTYNPIMEEGEPYQRISKNPEGYGSRCNNHKYGFTQKMMGGVNHGTRYPKSIRRVSRDFSAQQQIHPTQKPVPLLEWLIRTYSNEGELVLDNCMGSGSTGQAAGLCNRNFIGIELDKTYFDLAKPLIENIYRFNDLQIT